MITNRHSSRYPRRSRLHASAMAALMALALMTLGSIPVAQATGTHEGFVTVDRVFDWDRDQPSYGLQQPNRGNSGYGSGHDEDVAGWAVGTFRGQNSGNGVEETIVIRPDGSAELRTRDHEPRYGTFAGETLTFGNRISRVRPAAAGVQVDGTYYDR